MGLAARVFSHEYGVAAGAYAASSRSLPVGTSSFITSPSVVAGAAGANR
jgi:hypothetical protein